MSLNVWWMDESIYFILCYTSSDIQKVKIQKKKTPDMYNPSVTVLGVVVAVINLLSACLCLIPNTLVERYSSWIFNCCERRVEKTEKAVCLCRHTQPTGRMSYKKDHSSLWWGTSQALDKDIMWGVNKTLHYSDIILNARKRNLWIRLKELFLL